MQFWQTTACALLVGGLLTPSLGAQGFEPLTIRAVARQFGVGWGGGYHARPCHPRLRAFYDCVTEGGTPLGFTDARSLHADVRNAGNNMFFPASDGRALGSGVGTQAPSSSYGAPAGAVNDNADDIADDRTEFLPHDVLPGKPIPSDGENARPQPSGPAATPQPQTPETAPSPSDKANETAGYPIPQVSTFPHAQQYSRPLSPNELWSQHPPATHAHQSPAVYRSRPSPQPTPSPQPPRDDDWPTNFLWH